MDYQTLRSFLTMADVTTAGGGWRDDSPTLLIDTRLPVDATLEAIETWFGENRTRRALQLVIEETRGILTRDSAVQLSVQSEDDRGEPAFDTSAYLVLPGEDRYPWRRLRCPIADCPTQNLFAVVGKGSLSLRCPLHQQPLVLV